jgi:hypothetical protein
VDLSSLATEFLNYYNDLSDKSCDPFMRKITSISAIPGSIFPAITPNGSLQGFRCGFEISGLCDACASYSLFDPQCADAVLNNCCPKRTSKAPDGKMMAEASMNSVHPITRVTSEKDVGPTKCNPVAGKKVLPFVDFKGILKCYFTVTMPM